MRAIDWGSTPVGPPERWPQSLRTAVSIMLECKFGMMIAWGRDFIQFYNDPFRPILGASKHPAVGRSVRDTFAEAWHIIAPLFEQVMQGHAVGFEDMLVPLDRNGYLEECYFFYSYTPIRDESGGVGGLHVTVNETTARVLAERRLRTLRELASRAAQSKEEADAWKGAAEVLARNPADVPFALLYLVDDDGRSANLLSSRSGAAFAPLSVALGREATAGWPLDVRAAPGQLSVVGDVRERFGEIVGSAWPEPILQAAILPVTRPGLARPYGFLVTGVNPRHALDEGYRDFFVLVADQMSAAIANIRAFQEERQRADSLAQLDRQKTAFFSSISHEFRTPLTLILAPLEDARGKQTAALAGEALDVVQRNARRLLKLVNTLLDFSRIEAGRAEARFLPIDVSTLTKAVASSFHSLLTRVGLSLEVSCPPLPEVAYVDPEMWEKIVLNLISNAFKFTLAGVIEVSIEAAAGSMVLSVRDTGTGIPESELPRLFERFYRVEGAKGRGYEGSGIGLSLVQELVKMHGGSIAVESQLGVGTRFRVTMPLGHAHLPPERVGAAPSRVRASAAFEAFVEEAVGWTSVTSDVSGEPQQVERTGRPRLRRPGTILFADDNPDMREYVRKVLMAEGWAVDVVDDGQAALERALRHVPDLVLADVMMPRLDGFGLLQALKEHHLTRQVPVILLSARAGDEAAVEGIERGADDYVAKPFSSKELVSRVAARLEVSGARSDAARARERLQGQFMQAPVAVSVVTGPHFVYELANPLYLQLVGRHDIIGKPIRDVFPELPPDAPVFQMLEGVYASGEPFSASEYHVSLDRQGRGASEDVYFKFTCQPVRDDRGAVTEIMTVAIDVTAETLARQRIEALVQELQLADQRKDEFLATLAHELRNPMAAIRTALSLIESSGADVEKAARYRDTARRQMSNLVRLVDDLLDVARITHGKVDLRKGPADIAVVLSHALAAVEPFITAREHALHVNVEAGKFDMQADTTRLEQVIVNLLTNAAKYTNPGGKISVELRRDEQASTEQALLFVRDNGRGIPKAMLAGIFEVFTQVSPTIDRGTGGLGLGLTLCKRLIEMHGGTIAAFSDGPGKGSEFLLRLPLTSRSLQQDAASQEPVFREQVVQQAVAEEEAEPLPAVSRPSERAERRLTLLIVEDSRDARELLQEYLEALGHQVHVAADGTEGLSRLIEVRPDVALIDIGLPGMDGYEVARRIRALPEGASFFLAALTGYGGQSVRKLTVDAGFDVHLTKPVELDALSALLDRCAASPRR